MPSFLSTLREVGRLVAGSAPRAAEVVGLTDAALMELLREVEKLHAATDGLSARIASEIARRSARELGHAGLAARAGFNEPAKLVQDRLGGTLAEARRLVDAGDLLTAADAVAGPLVEPGGNASAAPLSLEERLEQLALLPGEWTVCLGVAVRAELLSSSQAVSIRSGLGSPPDDAATPGWRAAALELIRAAARARLNSDDLLRAARRRRGELDRQNVVRLARERYELRSATRRLNPVTGMAHWTLIADPESDAKLRAAVDAITAPRRGVRFVDAAAARAEEAARDSRSLEQLSFDAVFAVITAGIDSDPRRIADPAPVARILMTREELHAEGIAHLEGHADPIPVAQAQRSICDAGYVPIVFSPSGEPLDVGRRIRTFTSRQREALAARDGGCRAPGCTRPPSQCEAHHLREWSRGGATELENGILLCRFHHLGLHANGGRISRDVDQGTDHGGGSNSSARGEERFWMHRPGASAPLLLPSKSGALQQLLRST